MTDDDLKARFPGVTILHKDADRWPGDRIGWGVELDGKRNAWLFEDTPENHAEARVKAALWLQSIAEPACATASGAT